jgi:hypothetical protein
MIMSELENLESACDCCEYDFGCLTYNDGFSTAVSFVFGDLRSPSESTRNGGGTTLHTREQGI